MYEDVVALKRESGKKANEVQEVGGNLCSGVTTVEKDNTSEESVLCPISDHVSDAVGILLPILIKTVKELIRWKRWGRR